MSVTNLQVIGDALRMLNVINEIETPSAEQGSLCLRELNQMMTVWLVSDGINLGYFAQSSTAAVCPIPDWAEAGVKYSLAVRVASHYGASMSIEAAASGKASYDAMLRTLMNQRLEGVDMSHLPIGSGRIYGDYDISTGQ